MRIGIPKERLPNETRVAATPKTVEQLLKLGFSVAIESGAGQLASFDDKAFAQAGADIVDGNAIWQSEIILKVNAPEEEEIALLNPGTTLVSFIWPAQNPGLMEKLAERKVTVMAMDSVPRISRAQSLDALSSMANIAGYRAIVEAAHEFDSVLRKALSSQQLASRIEAYEEAQNILEKELPILPLASSLRLQAYRYDIKGLVLSPFGNASFAGVSREKHEEVKKP